MAVGWITWACLLLPALAQRGVVTEEDVSPVTSALLAAQGAERPIVEEGGASVAGPEPQDRETWATSKEVIRNTQKAFATFEDEQQSYTPTTRSFDSDIPNLRNVKREGSSDIPRSTIGDTRENAESTSAGTRPVRSSSSSLTAMSLEAIPSGETSALRETALDRRAIGLGAPQPSAALPTATSSGQSSVERTTNPSIEPIVTGTITAKRTAAPRENRPEASALSFESILSGKKSDQKAVIQIRSQSEETKSSSLESVFSRGNHTTDVRFTSESETTTGMSFESLFLGKKNKRIPTTSHGISKAGIALSLDSISSGGRSRQEQTPLRKSSETDRNVPFESISFDGRGQPATTRPGVSLSGLSLVGRRQSAGITAGSLLGDRPLAPPGDVPNAAEMLPIVVRLRNAGVLMAGELSLTICGRVGAVYQSLIAWPDTRRIYVCDNCSGIFVTDIKRDERASVHVLLAGGGCVFRSPPGPMRVWARNPVLLLGAQLPCDDLMTETMFKRVADTICLDPTGRLRRAIYGRNGVITLGFWSAQDGLQLTDTRTALQPNGHFMAEGTEFRVAFVQLSSGGTVCVPSAGNSSVCSSIAFRSTLKLHTKAAEEFTESDFYHYHNITPLYLNPKNVTVSRELLRQPKGEGRALQLLIDGQAECIWPFRFSVSTLFEIPVSVVNQKSLKGIVFIVLKRYDLVITALIKLFSWDVWLCVLVAVPLFGALLPSMVTGLGTAHGFFESMALLLGQSSSSFQRIRFTYRPFGAIWILMGMILTTAYLSDLIGQLTKPKIIYPRNPKELFEQGFIMRTPTPLQNVMYRTSPNPYTRKLGRSMIVQRYKKSRDQMLSQRVSMSIDLRASLNQAIKIINETDGLITLDDIHISMENLHIVPLGRIFTKNHPLADYYSKFLLRVIPAGNLMAGRVIDEARYLSDKIKRSACRRKSPGCEMRFRVKPLDLSRVQGPLAVLAIGLVVALLVLLTELVVDAVSRRRHRPSGAASVPVEALQPCGSG